MERDKAEWIEGLVLTLTLPLRWMEPAGAASILNANASLTPRPAGSHRGRGV
jgi:hypothetical protein